VVTPQGVVPQSVQPRERAEYPANRLDNRPEYRPNYRPDRRWPYYPSSRPYYRPYYAFRPRVRLGFGLWVGYPVVYPYAYSYPQYGYSYPSYSYSSPMSIYAAPVAASGGLSFDITPLEASIYVDGLYMGTVSQYTPDQPPLWLIPGRHYVEIREPGFELVAFYVDITSGQIIPYHGDLRRF
jgi:hypothetical protein